ncbi:MAG: bifunctional adenosylcobinamide kinase/adenosylcobinamide-phosphate guanylyltransferase [Acidimicrobiia bacterium]|nr:bifunctional adenosylcobinamide kinase/adenosylcobinamide-phosphate guanylyltransferase [Acidimicrobiia bacterium]
MLTLVLGGARSGKSTLAVTWGRAHAEAGGVVQFLATAPSEDTSLEERVARHRAERPGWPTIEVPIELAAALAGLAADDMVIVDCLTLWVSNLMARGDGIDAIVTASEQFATAAHERSGPTVVITNEVGMGVHPATELGRDYRDTLGLVNQRVSSRADRAMFLVAGRVLELGDQATAPTMAAT